MRLFIFKSKKELLIKNVQIGDSMFSYLPTFDWNSGHEVDPFGWLWEDDSAKISTRKPPRSIKIQIRK